MIAHHGEISGTLSAKMAKGSGGPSGDETQNMIAFGARQELTQRAPVIRRFTPAECEALQGFPRGHTAIEWRARPIADDAARYRAAGNSMAVPVLAWILNRARPAL
jgi:DNA (cytosine-5)-methyltransferase 1